MTTLRVLNMDHVDEWKKTRELPSFLAPRGEFSLSPCDDCSAPCCAKTVHMSAVEAVRMAMTLGVPLEDFAVAESHEPYHAYTGVAVYHPIVLDEGEARLALRKSDRGECVFLLHIRGRGRCGAYMLRPGLCRFFPYEVEDDEGSVRVGADVPCPTGWLYDESVAERLAGDLRQWRADVDLDAELVQAWNEAEQEDRSLAGFARWAIFELAETLGHDPERLYPPPRRRLGDRAGSSE
jgi:Fe-S-cluster containining protein